jgi:membrane-associated phospholipid phosphatase
MRPAEKVLAAFLAYASVRLVLSGGVHLAVQSLPPVDLLIVFALVLALRLFSDYRRMPWPEATQSARLQHLGLLGVFALLASVCLIAFPAFHPAPGKGGGVTELVLTLHAWVFAVLLLLAPFSLFWLASAQHIKAYGRLDTVGMLRVNRVRIVSVVREWFPTLALIYFYSLMGPVIGKGLFGDLDGPLGRGDRLLFLGHDPRLLLEPLISRPLSTWLSACYVLYVPLFPVVMGVVFMKRDLAPFRELAFAVTLTLATGYIVYTLVPAQGPLFVDHFDVPLDGYYGDWIKRDLMDRTRVPRDCFPSLHTAVSLTLLWGAFRHARRLFWVLLPVVACIPLACVYLRYHYVVDVLAGFALFAFVAGLSVRSRSLQSAFRDSLVDSKDDVAAALGGERVAP